MRGDGRPVYMNDKGFDRGVVMGLGRAVVLSIVGCIWLSKDRNVPDALVAIGSGALGALAGLFK